jgi:hypothetical protein
VAALIRLLDEVAAVAAAAPMAVAALSALFNLFCCRFKYNGLLLSFRTRLAFPFGLFLDVSGGSFSLSLAVPFFSIVDLLSLFAQVEIPYSATGSFVVAKQ